jgi:pyruvate dehydrogenase kinase 2/3/4
VYDLEDSPEPVTVGHDEGFTNLLSRIFEEHTEVIQAMAFGVQDLMAEMGASYAIVQPEVDGALRRFFIARIGLRFLLQHHIESYRNRDGCSGILHLECNPANVAKKAAGDSTKLCRAHLGQSPPILIDEVQPGTFTYVPMHLHYMLIEVLKNSCRAVVERHADGFDDQLPPVRVRIVHGRDDLTLKISDEGGGFSRAFTKDVYKFMWSTYKKSPWDRERRPGQSRPSSADSIANPLQRPKQGHGAPSGVLAGYGVGLSLSRLYAQYFGGDLRILSLDGFGTDVYLHLSSLGNKCENLPKGVLHSPSMRDSSLLEEHDAEERLLISADEESFLRHELLNLRGEKKMEAQLC